MTQRLCPRCHQVVVFEDEGTLVFCTHCGAPQVKLSEELLQQSGQQGSASTDPAAAATPASDPAAIVWAGALQTALLATGIGVALALVAIAIPPAALLTWFWVVGAPMFVLRMYAIRFPKVQIPGVLHPSFGARLGAVTGLAIVVALCAVDTASLLLRRYLFHSTADTDAYIAAMFSQLHAQMADQLAQSGQSAAAVASSLNLLNVPDFRIGILLSSAALFLVVYLTYAALAGALAGLLRSRTSR